MRPAGRPSRQATRTGRPAHRGSRRLRYATFCSGVEGVSLAWEPLGFVPVFFSEIEAFPSAVLAHHWPRVPNLGDMTRVAGRPYRGLVDILWGSTPCQAFSFAGLRRGLGDGRGQLTLAFAQRVEEIDPTYVCWENVKGVLSDKNNAFGCLLGALAGEDVPLFPPGKAWPHAGYVLGPTRTVAWRLFDAQHGGVPQRRERVFVVASSRNGADPRDILFEREGVRRDTPPGRPAAAAVAAPTVNGVGAGGADDGQAQAGRRFAAFGDSGECHSVDLTNISLGEIAGTIDAAMDRGNRGVAVICVTGDVTHALKGEGADGSEDGTGRGNPIIAFSAKDYGADAMADLSPTLRAMGHAGSHANAGGQMAVAYGASMRGREAGATLELAEEISAALRGASGGGSRAMVLLAQVGTWIGAKVRRLTPRECERLQGMPDDHTRVPFRGRPADKCPDGPRYKSIGNGLARPDVEWIGARIARFHAARARP